MRVSGHKSERSIRSLTPGRKNSPRLSVVPVLLKILCQLALQLWRCMSRQVKILLVEKHSAKLPCYYTEFRISYSQETVNFNAGAFSG